MIGISIRTGDRYKKLKINTDEVRKYFNLNWESLKTNEMEKRFFACYYIMNVMPEDCDEFSVKFDRSQEVPEDINQLALNL